MWDQGIHCFFSRNSDLEKISPCPATSFARAGMDELRWAQRNLVSDGVNSLLQRLGGCAAGMCMPGVFMLPGFNQL